MRNRVAHKLDTQVTEHAKRELWEMLPEVTKQSLRSEYEKDTDPLLPMPLARIFHSIIVWTDIFRQGAKRQRIEMKYAYMSADRVMQLLDDEEGKEAEASKQALQLIYSPGGSSEEKSGQPIIDANGQRG
jgi:hypothetical protein